MNSCSKKTVGLVCTLTVLVVAVSTPNSNAAALDLILDVQHIQSGEMLSADGADVVIEAIEFRDGTDPKAVRNLPGAVRYTPLVVTYNRDQNQTQQTFHQGIQDWVDDARTLAPTLPFWRNVSLVTLASDGSELERADLSQAFPIYFNPVTPDVAPGADRWYELRIVFDNLQITSVPEPSSLILPAIICVLWMRAASSKRTYVRRDDGTPIPSL